MNGFILAPDGRVSDRRKHPTLFAASSMYLFAGAGIHLLPYVLYLLYYIARVFAPETDISALSPVAEVFYYAVFCVLPIALYGHKHPGTADAMRVNGISPAMAALSAAAAVAGVFFVTYLTYLWVVLIEALGGVVPDSGIAVPETASALFTSIITVGVIPGVCEEVLFRGAILGAWEKRGVKYAMLVSAVLFMGLHGSVAGMPTQFILGLVIAFFVVAADSLFAGIIYHTVHNSVSMMLAYVSARTEVPESAAGESMWAMMGGASGLISVIVQTAFFGFLLVLLMRCASKRRAREKRAFGLPALPDEGEMSWQTLLILCAGAITVGVMYIQDILAICGVIV